MKQEESNSWSSTDIIEYQRMAFKSEISTLRQQISAFATTWVKRLDDIEDHHENQLLKVQNWLTKVCASHFVIYLKFETPLSRISNWKFVEGGG